MTNLPSPMSGSNELAAVLVRLHSVILVVSSIQAPCFSKEWSGCGNTSVIFEAVVNVLAVIVQVDLREQHTQRRGPQSCAGVRR